MKSMRTFCFLAAALLPIALAACGSSTKTEFDNETTGQSAFSGVEEATSAAADDATKTISNARVELDPSAYDAAPNQATASVTADFDVTRTCTATSGVVSVTATHSGSLSKTTTRPKATVAVTGTASLTITRTWTPASGQSLSCTDNHVKVNWKDDTVVDGLSMASTVNGTNTFGRTVTVTASGKQTTATSTATVSGTRTVTWAKGTGADSSTITRTKTHTGSVTYTKSFTKKDGSTGTINNTHAVNSDAPMVVTVVRDATTGALKTKTIVSGTLVTTNNTDASHHDGKYSNVVFDFSSDDVCLPTSGSISGSLYASGETTASKTWVIKFGSDATTDSGVSISYDGGAEEDFPDYQFKGCELEREI